MRICCTVVCLISVVGGCDSGPKKALISGTVTFDGQPLSDATMQVDSNDGSLPEAVKIVEGKFASQVTIGSKTIRFAAMREVERDPNDPEGLKPPHDNILPLKYSVNSKFKLDVKPDGNAELNYELESD